MGFDVHLFDRDRALQNVSRLFTGVSHVLNSVPPDGGPGTDPVIAHHLQDLGALSSLRWAGYLSTTGVYGDTAGQMVDEEAEPHPASERAKRRLAAETAWRALAPAHVFRLPGIYGPGRSAIDALHAGTARVIERPGRLFNRVHVDDIAGALWASMAAPEPGALYNICDDEPAEPAAVMREAARLLGVDAPPGLPFAAAEATMSAMARGFWNDNRVVSNERLKTRLGYRLRYPSYREGLAAIVAARAGSEAVE